MLIYVFYEMTRLCILLITLSAILWLVDIDPAIHAAIHAATLTATLSDTPRLFDSTILTRLHYLD